MPSFAYVARSASGEEHKGLVAAGSIDEVVDHLHSKGLVVLHVADDWAGRNAASWGQRFAEAQIGRTSTRDLALFTRQLATVIAAGIPLTRGLKGLSADGTNRSLSRTVSDVALRIERGEPLSDAMAANPRSFDRMYVSMIHAGERAGTLDKILEELAVYLEKVDAIKTKVKAAMSYPIFILMFAVLASLFLLLQIVPTFEEIYRDLGQQLPALTRAVLSVSWAIRNNFAVCLAGVAALGALLWLWFRTPSGRLARDGFFLSVPVFGPIVRKAVMSRFSRTFGILVQSGLPILEALDLVKGATANAVVEQAIDRAKAGIEAGSPITASFRETGKFPEMVLQLMATGEESGELDNMLLKASDFYDRQVEASVHSLTSLIEPILIVLVGAMVGIIVITMFLPIFHLGDAVMKGGYNY